MHATARTIPGRVLSSEAAMAETRKSEPMFEYTRLKHWDHQRAQDKHEQQARQSLLRLRALLFESGVTFHVSLPRRSWLCRRCRSITPLNRAAGFPVQPLSRKAAGRNIDAPRRGKGAHDGPRGAGDGPTPRAEDHFRVAMCLREAMMMTTPSSERNAMHQNMLATLLNAVPLVRPKKPCAAKPLFAIIAE